MVPDPTNQSSVPLVRHDLSDLGSEILIRILPKEPTLKLTRYMYYVTGVTLYIFSVSSRA